jgi:hypothetical protein
MARDTTAEPVIKAIVAVPEDSRNFGTIRTACHNPPRSIYLSGTGSDIHMGHSQAAQYPGKEVVLVLPVVLA